MPRRRTSRFLPAGLRALLPKSTSRKRSGRRRDATAGSALAALARPVPAPGGPGFAPRRTRCLDQRRPTRSGRRAQLRRVRPGRAAAKDSATLVLLLHGCGETPAEFADATRFPASADRNGSCSCCPTRSPATIRSAAGAGTRPPISTGTRRARRPRGHRGAGRRRAGPLAGRPAAGLRGRAVGGRLHGADAGRGLPGRVRRGRGALRAGVPLRVRARAGADRDGGPHGSAAPGAGRTTGRADDRRAGRGRLGGASRERRPRGRPVARVPGRRRGTGSGRSQPVGVREHHRRAALPGPALVHRPRAQGAGVLAGRRPRARLVGRGQKRRVQRPDGPRATTAMWAFFRLHALDRRLGRPARAAGA